LSRSKTDEYFFTWYLAKHAPRAYAVAMVTLANNTRSHCARNPVRVKSDAGNAFSLAAGPREFHYGAVCIPYSTYSDQKTQMRCICICISQHHEGQSLTFVAALQIISGAQKTLDAGATYFASYCRLILPPRSAASFCRFILSPHFVDSYSRLILDPSANTSKLNNTNSPLPINLRRDKYTPA
jgi:hypothetical protein